MEWLGHHGGSTLPSHDGPLLSLGDAFADRFHSWHGASGTRYVMSVFPAGPDAELPAFESCVVLPVARDGRTRRALGVLVLERGRDRQAALAAAGLDRIDEWHVHLLAGDRWLRAEVAADLRAKLDLGTRHDGPRARLA